MPVVCLEPPAAVDPVGHQVRLAVQAQLDPAGGLEPRVSEVLQARTDGTAVPEPQARGREVGGLVIRQPGKGHSFFIY